MKHTIDGIRYNVETNGDGFPVILLHGFTGDASTWFPFFERWGTHSTVYAVDIIGHGKSDSPDSLDRYKMMSVVDDLFLLLEKLNLRRVDIVGYSMGGRLALSFAVKYPRMVRKLILESTSPGLDSLSERQQRIESDERLATFIEEKGIEAFVDYWENIPLFSSQKRLPRTIQAQIRKQRLGCSSIGLANSLRGMGTGSQPSWWEELPYLSVGTLILTGALDEKFCRIGEKMAKLMKDSQLLILQNSGHAIHVENYEEFGTIVSRFLSE